jgi:pimeloyl-ACP methyl ester carboxylesterase
LFVWSSHDQLIPAGFSRYVSEWLPSAEQIVLEACGHAPQVERPEQTNGLLARFFAQVDALRSVTPRARAAA